LNAFGWLRAYAALPREICDRVYFFNLKREQYLIALRVSTSSQYRKTMPHWFQPAFVGKEVARECAQILYEQSSFVIEHHDVLAFHRWLDIDHYSLGIGPTAYIRSIYIELSLDYVPNAFDLGEMDRRKKQLASLLKLKQRSAVVEFFINLKDRGTRPALIFFLPSLRTWRFYLHCYTGSGLSSLDLKSVY
jgi:hypothetical protein